jgi:hypothetical protein
VSRCSRRPVVLWWVQRRCWPADVPVRTSDMILNVNVVSVRQALTPLQLQGRVGATLRVLTYGVVPVGAFLGGQLGATFGLRGTVVGGESSVWLRRRGGRRDGVRPAPAAN